MADVALQFAVETLVGIIKENWKLLNLKEDSAHLKAELDGLKALLEDAAKYRKSNSQKWKHFVKEVQVMVYKAEGLIDKLLVEKKLHKEQTLFEKGKNLIKYPTTVRELAIKIRDALEQVKKIREENPTAFEPKPMLDDQPAEVFSQDTLLEENEVIGFDEEIETVIKRLDEGTDDLDVIPVVGMPGLGKTTLANKIIKHPTISYKFFNRTWVNVGQQYKLNEVLLNILGGFTRITEEYQQMDVNELPKKIGDFICKGGKCLIVLDDVWNPDVVKSVMDVFPEGSKGHRIMVTTRDTRIGRYANAEPHFLKYLKDEESFDLLKSRVFRSKDSCPEELVSHGKSIAEQCSGVPLAVVVIAGALRGQRDRSVWQIVQRNVSGHLINEKDPKSCLKFVETSYNHLPEDMKACFLYCGAFPQGFEISAWKLIRLWISEGLISSKLKASPEEIAELRLNDLVNRNLVMVMRKRADGQVKTCRLHDMLHQFCKMEAINGGLFQEVCKRTDEPGLDIPDQDTSHRLCIQLSLLEDFISKEPSTDHVRSFLCFSAKQKGSEQLSKPRLLHKAFPLVRVLDVEPLKFSFSKEFFRLYHLRYIAISGEYTALPKSFGPFWNLQTLILNTEKSPVEIKADIWNMTRLRHLHTNVPAKLPSPPTKTAEKQTCLQTLSKVAPESCSEDVLARACDLKKVSIEGEMTDFLETNKGGFSNFEKLKYLVHLKVLNTGSYMNKVLQLPREFSRFLSKLEKLTLSNTKFAWSDADILGMLECLEVLKLKENAFTGPTWEAKGFSQLKVLWIQRADLEIWKASGRPFQGLQCLVLKSCDKLGAVPSELAHIRTLREMTLENTNKAIKSAKAIQSQAPENFKFKLTIFPPETAECSTSQLS